jgi:hypothetical protein
MHRALKVTTPPTGFIGSHWYPGTFGWGTFVLWQKNDKLKYMAVLALENLTYNTMKLIDAIDLVNQQVGKEIIEVENREVIYSSQISYHIDHQSVLALPKEKGRHTKNINWEFWHEFTEYLISDHQLIIVGGNDNDWLPDNSAVRQLMHEGIVHPFWEHIPMRDEAGNSVRAEKIEDKKWLLKWKSWDGKRVHKYVVEL